MNLQNQTYLKARIYDGRLSNQNENVASQQVRKRVEKRDKNLAY